MDELELRKFDMRRIKPTHVCAFLAQRNSGKCLAKGTEVLMYDGSIKKIEDIMEGELVMGDDQTSRTVLNTTSGVDDMFEVENTKGIKYTVNSSHILSLKHGDIFLDIGVMDYLKLPEEEKNMLNGYQITNRIGIYTTNSITVTPVGKGEYYGFSLDGNHRFVLGNSVVTHNSFLIKDLLYYQQNIPAGLVVSKTDKLTNYYGKFIPPVLIHDEYSPELLDKLFDRQKKALEEEWPNPHAFLIFDDTLSDAGVWKKDGRVKEIFFNGRHYKILFLLTMQDPMAITPGLRCNIDFTFILRTPNQKNRKDLYDNYCGMFPSREIFEKVLDACTEDFGCLVIDNTTRSNKLEDQVFYYKASDHEPFKLCSNQFWQKRPPLPPKRDQNTTEQNFILRNKGKKFIVRKN